MSFTTIRRVAIVGARKAPIRAFSAAHAHDATEAALSYTAKDAVAKVSHPSLIFFAR